MKLRKRIAELACVSVLSVCAMNAFANEALVGLDEKSMNESIVKGSTVKEEDGKQESQETSSAIKWKVAIDPGHQGSWVDMSAQEPSAPGSSETKAKATTGTEGRYSNLPEYELNLQVSLVLRDVLEERGYEVVMTREDNDKAISNMERAVYAAEQGADILVRIHANGSDDGSVNGALTMVPSQQNPYVGYMYDECYELGSDILTRYCSETGFASQGVQYYDNMSGINWSTIPVTILEMGYMTNESEDLQMADESFWPVMAEGIAKGIDDYFADKTPEQAEISETVESPGASETAETSEAIDSDTFAADDTMNALKDELIESMAVKADSGEVWAAAVIDLDTDTAAFANSSQMQAASLIKLFICGAVYERYEELTGTYDKDQIDGLLNSMITVSDNDAANSLTRMLGDGEEEAGRKKVTSYCKKNGYDDTVMGRMLLASKENGDNLTSVADCAKFLTRVYHGKLPHSEEIVSLLKNQERTAKIPAGLPEGVVSGNKTGELDDVENDAAIIFAEKPYILCVMSEYLTDVGNAQRDIAGLSSEVYEFAESQF